MTEQLTLFETSAPGAAPVWSTLSAEERTLVVSVLARLMARAVADLREHGAHAEKGDD